MCHSLQIDHFISEKSQDHDGTDPNSLHFSFLTLLPNPVFPNQEAIVVPASCFSKLRKDAVLQPRRSRICNLKAPDKEISMSRCFHWRIHKLKRINIGFTNLFRKIADSRVLSNSFYKVGIIVIPNQPKMKENRRCIFHGLKCKILKKY